MSRFGTERAVRIEGGAVVEDPQGEPVGRAKRVRRENEPGRVAVFDGVGDGLLDDVEEIRKEPLGKAFGKAFS